jgi:hypothetical protein
MRRPAPPIMARPMPPSPAKPPVMARPPSLCEGAGGYRLERAVSRGGLPTLEFIAPTYSRNPILLLCM